MDIMSYRTPNVECEEMDNLLWWGLGFFGFSWQHIYVMMVKKGPFPSLPYLEDEVTTQEIVEAVEWGRKKTRKHEI